MNAINFKLQQLETTTSTNADAKQAATNGAAEGLVIQALSQNAGVGRQGREWHSPVGNIYASILLHPHCAPQTAGHYSFVTALAVHDCIRHFLPDVLLELKWPNDVLVNGKKISGILLEAAPIDNGVIDWLVIGVGVNVLHYPDNGAYPATSILAESLAGKGVTVQTVLDALLLHFGRWCDVLRQDGFAPIRTAWLEKARKGPLTARLPHETVPGEFAGLDGQGNLILRLADGSERAIAAGDVFFTT